MSEDTHRETPRWAPRECRAEPQPRLSRALTLARTWGYKHFNLRPVVTAARGRIREPRCQVAETNECALFVPPHLQR